MGRIAATAVHLTLWVLSGVLYFLFVLPRWWELMGDTSHTLGTVLRIVAGVLMALAALPVLLTLQRARGPETDTPQLALRLRVWSMILHVLAGVLIVGAAVTEIWVSLDTGGTWLFGIYGAAAAIAILGLLAFQLAYTAALPAKPQKPKKEKKKRGKTADVDETVADETEGISPEEVAAEPAADEIAETTAIEEPAAADDEQPAGVPADTEPDTADEPEPAGGLRNKRPTGKTNHRLRRRNRGTLTVDE